MFNNKSCARKEATRVFSRVFGAVAAYSALSIALVYLIETILSIILGQDKFLALSENAFYLWELQVFSMYLVAFPMFLILVRKLPSARRERGEITFKEFVHLFLISEAVMIIGSIISNIITGIFEDSLGHEIPNTTADMIEKTPIGLIILVVVVIGPIVEEMIFRKVMIDRLSVYGDKLAVVLSSVAFGLFHGKFYQLFYATALGLILGYVYTKTRKSKYNCLLHMIVNFMGTIPSMLTQDALERLQEVPEGTLPEGTLINDYYAVMGVSLLMYALAIIGIFVFIKAVKNRAFSITNNRDITLGGADYPKVCLFNLGVIAFLIVNIGQCIFSLFLT